MIRRPAQREQNGNIQNNYEGPIMRKILHSRATHDTITFCLRVARCQDEKIKSTLLCEAWEFCVGLPKIVLILLIQLC
jgi:hypothetical protein